MAKKVDALPPSSLGKYPWDEWLDGDVWELEPKEDFDIRLDNFRSAVYQAAAARNVSVTVRQGKNGMVYVQATPLEDELF